MSIWTFFVRGLSLPFFIVGLIMLAQTNSIDTPELDNFYNVVAQIRALVCIAVGGIFLTAK